MPDTRKDLVALLESTLPLCGATKASKVRALIEEARRGDFHDYKSPHAMPKVELVKRLRDASLNIVARRVMDGEFDEHADAADQAAMSLELKDEPMLRHALNLPGPKKEEKKK